MSSPRLNKVVVNLGRLRKTQIFAFIQTTPKGVEIRLGGLLLTVTGGSAIDSNDYVGVLFAVVAGHVGGK